jgi:autotransporter passenger strand-loop-strand repeat protein
MTTISVTSGITSSGMTIGSGTTLDVLSGGTVSGIIVSGGYENVASGGADYSATVESGGTLIVSGTSYNTLIISGGAVSVGANFAVGEIISGIVGTGGTLKIYPEASTSRVVVSGGFENLSGGMSQFDTVLSGGVIAVTYTPYASGELYGPYISRGGTVSAHSGTVVYGANLYSGGVIHSAVGATVFQTVNFGGSISPLCFGAGTHIDTERSTISVENLVVGDVVAAHFAGTAPIVWIGQRTIDCRCHARPEGVWPVRVRAGAFGEGVPRRDVLLSPDHAVFVGGVLVPVRELVDGGMIVQEKVERVRYFHVELKQHDVVFAEGLPVESYLDAGNRSNFQGEAGVIALHPEFAALAWDALACAPLVLAGPELEAVRRLVVSSAEPEWAQRGAGTA